MRACGSALRFLAAMPRALTLIVVLTACGRTMVYAPSRPPPQPDSGTPDSGAPDSGAPDSGTPPCAPACGPNTTCVDRQCRCDPGFTDCNGSAADGCEAPLDRDPSNCGMCGKACVGSLPACEAGRCVRLSWTELMPAARPPPRAFFSMTYDKARQRGVLFGGQPGNGPMLRDTWEWDGTSWTEVRTADAPEGRRDAAMTYDEDRGVVVLFGGAVTTATCGSAMRNDTWEYDGVNWRRVATETAPAPRGEASLVYDSARGVTVLFAGYECSLSCPSETWEYDGSTWTQRFPTRSPPERCGRGGAYDTRRKRFVVFGGLTGQTLIANDTWEYDGATWVERTSALKPPPRFHAELVYAPERGAAVLFGGLVSSNVTLGDTWEWDGSRWLQVMPARSPSSRYGHALFHDAAREQVVLFGGYGNTADTWVYESQ